MPDLLPRGTGMHHALTRLGIAAEPADRESAFPAGKQWEEYRQMSRRKDRIISDFLIGVFARIRADRLLTRDRGFYCDCFSGLRPAGA